MDKTLFQAVAFLIGTVIGAGVLGIPYVVQKSGIYLGIAYIVILGVFALIVNLYVGEVSLRTKGIHELTGYAEKFVGKWGKHALLISLLIEIYGALSAYLIGVSQSFTSIFGLSFEFWLIAFFIAMGLILYRGINVVKGYELFLNAAKIILMLAISIAAFAFFKSQNLAMPQTPDFVMPFGVIMFAFLGITAIPELKQILAHDRKQVKKAIIIGSIIPIIVYILFAIAVVGATGPDITEVATIGLGAKLGFWMAILGSVFAIFSMTTAFLAVSLALIWILHYDYKLNKTLSFILTMIIPIIIAFSGIAGFIKILGVSGAIAGGVTMVLCLVIFHKAKESYERKPEYELQPSLILSAILSLAIIIGIIATLII